MSETSSSVQDFVGNGASSSGVELTSSMLMLCISNKNSGVEDKCEISEGQDTDREPNLNIDADVSVNTENIKDSFLQSSRPSTLWNPFGLLKRKLLILDINGVLADIVSPLPKKHKAEKIIARQAIFRRPFCLDFMNFCFERFDVGIWSSRTKKNVDRVIDYLLGDMKQKLLFCWDASYCSVSKFNTIENRHKALVFKDLKRIWYENNPALPWAGGKYNESNTFLVDDSPYKAMLNPPYTGIFPHSYTYQDQDDNSLGPGGDLRVYLEGAVLAENVQKHVEQHPFGQSAISKSNSNWEFYLKAVNSVISIPTAA